ncbi:MAG: hypothetical protein ABFS28_09600 [Bacteroidota bacterium]
MSPKERSRSANKNISRKEAISKAGKYAVFTASSMMLILNPVKAQAEPSPDLPPDWYY